MEKITSRQNKTVSHLRALGRDRRYRDECGEYLCDGEKLLDEALKWNAEISCVLCAQKLAAEIPEGVSCFSVSRELLDYVSPLKNCQDVLFSVKMKPVMSGKTASAVVLEGIQDPGNLGTIIRTANALRIDSVILTGGCADLYNPKTVRAGMGAHFRQNVTAVELPELRGTLDEFGLKLYGAALSPRAADIRSVKLENAAVAIGSEGKGLSRELLSICEGEVIIPMNPACESLNAAIAAAIVMWECQR